MYQIWWWHVENIANQSNINQNFALGLACYEKTILALNWSYSSLCTSSKGINYYWAMISSMMHLRMEIMMLISHWSNWINLLLITGRNFSKTPWTAIISTYIYGRYRRIYHVSSSRFFGNFSIRTTMCNVIWAKCLKRLSVSVISSAGERVKCSCRASNN